MITKPLYKKDNDADAAFEKLAAAVRRKALAAITKQRKLVANLNSDLNKHGDPEQWKRFGDLLLANAANAVRKDDRVFVTDYFDEAAPTIEIEGEVNKTLSEIAESYFRRYVKARNGQQIIKERIEKTETAINDNENLLQQIDAAIEARDSEFLASIIGPKLKAPARQEKKLAAAFKGARRFTSSDGYEILVGKKAADNDYLTFRVARSLEIWMHAADYPGSHVVIRNPNKKEIPNQTLVEAAQLAAFYSNGRKQIKAAVNYTQKKFVNKPRKAAAGLVSLSSFKTILVEPKIGDVIRS